ncbi:MAG: autotransporter assembly complex protein TamA [Gammaproteobacteria bacterium]|jgi:translocation and assembly module TamA|nr:autotransporter assembly complex protein TamA [Gammaproteobacteria bacterium]
MSTPRYPLLLLLLLGTFISTQSWAQPVVKVDIKGIDTELETNVRLFLSIEQQRAHPLMSDSRIRRLHQKANAEIAAALQPYGFYQPEITSTLTEQEAHSWLASYVIDTGPGIPITEFNLNVGGEAGEDPAFKELIGKIAMKPGDIFVHPVYESVKSKLSGLASERGYVQAGFTTTRVEIDLKAYGARVYLDFDSGPRYSFGEVSLDQDVLEPELLQRYIPFQRGDPFSLGQVIRLQQALNDSNYFEVAEVFPAQPLADSQEIPINVSLTPRKNHRYNFGLGYGTDTGARAKFGWKMPRVNRRGHRIDSEIEVSEIGYNLGANYRVPVLNPRTDQLVYSISKEREKTDSNDSTLSSVGISLNHNRGKWREVLTLSYEREAFEVADDSGDSDLLIPGVSWTRTWGQEFINVLDGLRFDIGVRGASASLASDTDFLQLRGSIKFITSLGSRNRLLVRGSFGTTETPDFDLLPSSLRFFAGGSQSVRGYGYEDLGPTNDNGDVVGGKHLLTGSIEFEHFFNDSWGAAVFLDAGNAIDNLNDDLEQGAGFGFRWKSPVGPVRIDLANAISTDQSWRLHVSIGPDL